jgi:hypothetical protein
MYVLLSHAIDVCSAWVERHELLWCAIAAALLCALLIGRAIRFVLRPRRQRRPSASAVFDLTETLASLEASPDRPGSVQERPAEAGHWFPSGSGRGRLDGTPVGRSSRPVYRPEWEDETVNERPKVKADMFDLCDVATIAYPRGFRVAIREEKRQAHRRPTEPATNRWWRRIHPRTIARGSR